MTTKDLLAYACNNWESYSDSITNISRSDDNRASLVDNETVIYSFDKICKSLFPTGQVPTSVDGLAIRQKCIEFIEFKSGFKQKITKENIDKEKAYCKPAKMICEEFWNLFFENQERKLKELVTSIRFKAIESYITLEKHFFPLCLEVERNMALNLKLVVVIDEDGIDSMEDTLAQLAGKDNIRGNCFMAIKKSLKRLKNQHDASGNTYYYDNIEVMSAPNFSRYLEQNSFSL